MPDRQFPKPDEIFELMRFKKPELDAKKRRPRAALTIYDLRDIARRRTPQGRLRLHRRRRRGASSRSARARQAFQDIEFHPSILRDVAARRHLDDVFGGPSALPFGIAPTGFTRLMQTEGETAGAGAAGAAGIPFYAVHPRHHLDREREGRQPGRPQLVPALRHARPGDLLRPRPPRRRRRLRHAVLHRRRPRRRRAAARQAQRLLDPAAADARHRRSTRSRGRGGGATS